MPIHKIRSPFIHPNYTPNKFTRKSRHSAPQPQQGLNFFFSSIIGTETERKLAAMMNRQPQPVKA